MPPSACYSAFFLGTLLAGVALARAQSPRSLPTEFSSGLSLSFDAAPDSSYCLISDPCLHVNGLTGSDPSPSVRAVGIRSGNHSLELWASVPHGSTHPALTRARLDGRDLTSSLAHGESAKSEDKEVTVEAVEAGQNFLITLAQCSMRLLLRLQATATPAPHFLVDALDFDHLRSPHGIIGQTYARPESDGSSAPSLRTVLTGIRALLGQPLSLDGAPADYLSSSLSAPDCLFARFSREERIEENGSDLPQFPTGDDDIDETALATNRVVVEVEDETAVEVGRVTRVRLEELQGARLRGKGQTPGRKAAGMGVAGVVEVEESVEEIEGEGIRAGVSRLARGGALQAAEDDSTEEEEGEEEITEDEEEEGEGTQAAGVVEGEERVGDIEGMIKASKGTRQAGKGIRQTGLSKAGVAEEGEELEDMEGFVPSELEPTESTREKDRLGANKSQKERTPGADAALRRPGLTGEDLRIISATQGTDEVLGTQ